LLESEFKFEGKRIMRVLVTGGAGFIGSHLSEELVKKGCEVVIIDNLHTGNEKNIEQIRDKVEFIKADAGKARSAIKGKIDVIFHLGIYSSSPMYKENPLLVAKAIEDAINLLEFAKEQDAKFILASTSSIYNGLPLPWREDMKPRVSDYYTEARYCIERLLELYNKLYGLRGVVLRLFSVYGPREESKGRYANVISQFIWAMLKDEQPVIYGDGEQTRDFIYVSDVVRAFLLAMNYERSEFEIFNVGTGKET